MTDDYYFLVEHEIVPCDVFTWGQWHQMANCVLFRDRIGGILVSTIFFGLNRRSKPNDPPLIFETMVFGGDFGDYQERYATYSEAEAGHRRILAMVDDGILDAEFIGVLDE
jgi:hypothetical protein